MLKFLHTVKLGLIYGVVLFAGLALLMFAVMDISEKSERFSVNSELETLDAYFNEQLEAIEPLAIELASSAELTALFSRNNSQNRKILLKSDLLKNNEIDFISLSDADDKVIFSRQYNASTQSFEKLDSKTEYQISIFEAATPRSVRTVQTVYIYSDRLYVVAFASLDASDIADKTGDYVVIGRAVNESKVNSENKIDISLTAVNLAVHREQAALLEKFKSEKIVHIRRNESLDSHLLINGLNKKPLVIVTYKRKIPDFMTLLSVSWLSLIIIFAVSLGFGYLFWWNRKSWLAKSIRILEEDIQDVRIGTELSSRLSRNSRGILGGIVVEINQKIGGFEKTFFDNRKHNSEIILNELPLEAYLKDSALKYVSVNEKYSNSLGVCRDDILGRHNSEIEALAGLDFISSKEEEVIRTKEAVIFEETIDSKASGKIIYAAHLIPLLNAKGQIEGIVGVRSDITDQKQAENEMEMAAKVLENTAEGFMVTNADRRIVHVNAAYTEMTGYNENELLGKIPLLLQTESRSKTYQEIQQKLKEDGTWKGELWSSRKNGSSYPEMTNIKAIRNKEGEVTNYFSMSKDITEEKKWEKQLYEMAHYDSLTGLPNRTLFQDRITQEIIRCNRNERNLAVLFLDIDLFKAINDSLGHAAGDELLKTVANRLKVTLRNADSIARMGGDEFTILVTDLALDYKKNIGYLRSLSEKIIDVVNQPMEIEGREINVTCSVGVAVYPADANNVEDLIRNADSAMYYAKSQGRRNYQFYTKEFNESAVDRLEKEIEFRSALKSGSLEIYYQPQVDVISRHVVGAEALLRWNKDGENVLSTEKIISLAEEIGLINELGNWVLKTACNECKKWMKLGHKNMRVAVNLSTRQFRQKNLVEIVNSILAETGLPGRMLELEVTESALMESVEYSIEMMAELSRKGVRWSLDDFGTGYSSLNYLRDFPVHVLKIDQSFVREITINPEDSAIVETIIDLAHRLHLTVIAEGVENQEQLKALSMMNCELVQGYYFSKPRTSGDFIEYISKGVKV
ncbi:MAG: EAL domain-containing protein [Gammaproteobacteria bacterium]|nr:EAL domain-containing protein [Gammaproteobacteria bacterium]